MKIETEEIFLEHLVSVLGREQFKPDLENARRFCHDQVAKVKALNPQIITVAGTNGKGQVCRELAEALERVGKSYCLITSPHLKSVRERFRSQNGLISFEELVEISVLIHKRRESFEGSVSYYEFLFSLFLEFCLRRKPDYLVLEVGLGGRLDAANLFDAHIAVIVSIGRDHQEFLGRRLEQILFEKYGICRVGCTLISSLELKYLREKCKLWTQRDAIDWYDIFEFNNDLDKTHFSQRNRMVVEKICNVLFPKKMIRVVIPQGKPLTLATFSHSHFVLQTIGTHNVDGMRNLVQFLSQENYNKGNVYDVVALSFSKRPLGDIEVMLKILLKNKHLYKKLCLVHESFHKAVTENELRELGKKYSINVLSKWQNLLQDKETNSILFTGSNYFIGKIQHDISCLNS